MGRTDILQPKESKSRIHVQAQCHICLSIHRFQGSSSKREHIQQCEDQTEAQPCQIPGHHLLCPVCVFVVKSVVSHCFQCSKSYLFCLSVSRQKFNGTNCYVFSQSSSEDWDTLNLVIVLQNKSSLRIILPRNVISSLGSFVQNIKLHVYHRRI